MTYFPQYFLLAVSDKPGPEHSGIQPEENGPSVDAVSGNVEEEASCEKSANQDISSESTESTANSLAANDEPQPHPESSGLATPDESSTRTSALQETDDSDDDPVLIPGARYRGGPGHRLARQAPADLIPVCAYFLPAEYPSAKYLQFILFYYSPCSHKFRKLTNLRTGTYIFFQLYFRCSYFGKARAFNFFSGMLCLSVVHTLRLMCSGFHSYYFFSEGETL